MKPRCVITGCEIVARNTEATAHGDLHMLGDVFIFNAVRGQDGETRWFQALPASGRVIYVDTNYVFERRGVIVIPLRHATLSKQASDFIESAP